MQDTSQLRTGALARVHVEVRMSSITAAALSGLAASLVAARICFQNAISGGTYDTSNLRLHLLDAQDAFAAARHAHSPLADGSGSPGGHNLTGGSRHRPGLRSLSLDACSQVTAVGALEVLKACSHSLTTLNVSRTAVSSLQQSRWVRTAAFSSQITVSKPSHTTRIMHDPLPVDTNMGTRRLALIAVWCCMSCRARCSRSRLISATT